MRAQREHDPKQSVFLLRLDAVDVDVGFEKNFAFEGPVIDLQSEDTRADFFLVHRFGSVAMAADHKATLLDFDLEIIDAGEFNTHSNATAAVVGVDAGPPRLRVELRERRWPHLF